MIAAKCDRCHRPLRAEDPDPVKLRLGMPRAYLGTVCTKCGRIECYTCRGGVGLACSKCGGGVDGAFQQYFLPTLEGRNLEELREGIERARKTRLAAVESLSDQSELVAIAWADSDSDTRLAAVSRLTSAESLTALVGVQDSSIRMAVALSPVVNPETLATLARGDSDGLVREAAVRRVDDQSILSDISGSDPKPYVRRAAISRLLNAEALAAIARDDTDLDLKKLAVSRIQELARSAGDPRVRDAARQVEKQLQRPVLTVSAIAAIIALVFLFIVIWGMVAD